MKRHGKINTDFKQSYITYLSFPSPKKNINLFANISRILRWSMLKRGTKTKKSSKIF
jgi:hypothetical protein